MDIEIEKNETKQKMSDLNDKKSYRINKGL